MAGIYKARLNLYLLSMKRIKYLYLLLLIITGTSLISTTSVKVDKTVVYIVRHGEKDISDPGNPNPELNDAGRERALALAKELKAQKFDVIFSTQYKRTMNTVAPIARRYDRTIEFYDPKNPEALAELVKTKHRNKKILIAGHSNTVLELVEAFGGKRPVSELTEEDYDLLFKITIKDTGSELTTKRYGAPHHVTQLSTEL